MFVFQKTRRLIGFFLLLAIVLGGMLGALALYGGALWPSADGDKVYNKGKFVVDASHGSDGYIMMKYSANSSKLKVRISRNDTVYTYNLNSNGEYESFPLQMGSGKYTCSLYENISGNKYSQLGKVNFSVDIENEDYAYLYPNQYVNYGPDSPAVALSMEICSGLTTDEEKIIAVRDYIKKNFLYDFVKAATAPAGTLPDIDSCLEKRMGICQDLTALAACMLRVQGIPAKLVIGYADRNYHSWNSVLVNGEYRTLDVTADVKGLPSGAVYTVERCY